MPSLREEIEQAFADVRVTDDLRSLVVSLKTMEAAEFKSRLPAFMLASLDDPVEGDPIPAIIISEIPKRAAQMRALTPAQRRILAKYVASMAGDHELMKGHLLKALNELKPGG
ncbi:MAG TPA: hypothetical protein VM122_03720 [Usitatibacter sp.]|nr:hypothetical protein [Usitatibacter sp.]